MTVLDASALLAWLHAEEGAGEVEEALESGAVCSTANWSETAHRIRRAGADWSIARSLLLGYALDLVPVTEEDAERAAELGATRPHLSLGDRLCLALAVRLDRPVLTADRAWGAEERIRQLGG